MQATVDASPDALRLALATAGVGLLREELATGRITLDATACALLDLPEAPGRGDERDRLAAALHPEDRATFAARTAAARQGARVDGFELRLTSPQRGERRVRLQWVLRHDAAGAPNALIGVLQERSEAGPTRRTQSEFIARISHDLRTPLNAILGFCDLLQHSDRHPLADEPAEQVAYIERAGRQLRGLIDGLIDMARIDIGALRIRSGRADLGQAAATAWAEAAARAAQRRVRLQPFAPVQAEVSADAARLQQIVDALLDNAIRYNREDGLVELRLAPREGGWELAVHDTGAGMTAAELDAAFVPFARLREPAAARGQGLGFGLPIAAHAARAMGGRLEADSTPGSGSTFRLWLPDAAGAPAAEPVPPQQR